MHDSICSSILGGGLMVTFEDSRERSSIHLSDSTNKSPVSVKGWKERKIEGSKNSNKRKSPPSNQKKETEK